jgi:hypothetical protein
VFAARDNRVLGDPERIKANLFGAAGNRGQIAGMGGGDHQKSDIHGRLLEARFTGQQSGTPYVWFSSSDRMMKGKQQFG